MKAPIKEGLNIQKVPNSISLIRILISIALIFLHHCPVLFIAVYFLCGISDVMDGYLARRYKCETRLGEQLDTLGDAVFYSVILYLLVVYTDIIEAQWVITGAAIVAGLRVINFIVTRVKFKTWGAMHSWGNKATGILLYIYAPVALMHNTISFIPGLAIFFIAGVSSIEEMVILLTSEQYDANRKSLFRR